MKGDRREMKLDRGDRGEAVPGFRGRAMAKLKCIYTNAHSMGNKQEDLEAIVQHANL